jgi:hypothetical protein
LFDWNKSGIPSGINDEKIELQKKKEKEKKKKQLLRKKENKKIEEQNAIVLKNKLIEQKENENIEKIKNLEKLKLNAGVCGNENCKKNLFEIAAPYEVFDKKCCSSSCVVNVRRSLAASAALKRLNNNG